MSTYYITPWTGTGVRNDLYRSTITAYGVSYVPVIPSNPVTGAPLFSWVLVAIPDGANTTAIDADATFDKLPITSLDVTIGSLTNQQRTALQNIGAKYGITKIAGLKNSDTCRTALADIGQQLDPNFDPNTFSVI